MKFTTQRNFSGGGIEGKLNNLEQAAAAVEQFFLALYACCINILSEKASGHERRFLAEEKFSSDFASVYNKVKSSIQWKSSRSPSDPTESSFMVKNLNRLGT